jgi:Ca2+-binding RTX toxin-like protein
LPPEPILPPERKRKGAGGHDELYGGEGDDALHGGAGSDYLDGGDGDDSLEGGEGDDELDGGDGDDIAVFSGARVNYDVTTHTDGTTTVTHLNGGADGTDILENIEQLQFSDESIMTPPASAGGNPPENTAPSATSIGNQTAHPGAHFSMSAASHFTDSDPDDTLTYSIDGPSWLSIDAETGMISGTPPTHAVLEQLTSDANGGYALPASGTVHISAEFFSGSAGYNSSYGYYLADASGEPIGGAVIENNVKTLGSKGVTLDLDDFPGAATLGFFIIPDGARKNPSLTDGQPVEFQFDCGSWSAYADDVKLNGQGASIYFSDKALNSDDYDHLKDNGHNGNQNWEDLRGGGDKDFDDTNVEVSVVSEQMASDAIDGPVTVTATDSHGMTAQVSFQLAVAPAMAAMSANAAFAHAGQVQIEDETSDDGTVNAAENQPLSANLQLLVNADGISEIKYQWQYSADGQSWSPVPGATNSRFTPRQSEAGLSLRVALTFIFIDSALESQTAYSAPTAPVMTASSADSAQGQNGQTVNAVPENSANDTENGNEDQADENGEHAWRENEDIDFADLNLIHGSDGINFLRGTRQNDLIKAENGNDLVMAGRGDDVIIGGDGNDKLFGGKGNDTIYGGAGDDRIHGGEGDDVLYGEAGDDKLYGGEGDDQLDGGDGSDTLEGGKGDDILLGGAGNDTLLGGAGDDIIVGGEGDDILYGGAGRDTFVYGYNHGNNQIMDFEEDLDEIQLEQDAPTYSIVYTENGWEYLFDSGTTLVVHSNKGKGRNDDDYDDDLSFSVLAASTIGLGEETDDYGNEEWAELVAAGVIDLGNESVPAHGTEAGSDWLNDVDAPSLLSVSTILFSHEDGNLFG